MVANWEAAALVQAALAHLLNAEAEKIQKAVSMSDSLRELLEVNRSVHKTLTDAIHLEQVLYHQMDRLGDDPFWDAGEPVFRPEPPKHPCPKPIDRPRLPVTPCGEPAACVFSAAAEYRWNGCSALYLREASGCRNGVTLCRREGDTFILLPAGNRFLIETSLEVTNPSPTPLSAALLLNDAKGSQRQSEVLFDRADRYRLKDCRTVIWEAPPGGGLLGIRLLSSAGVKVETGRILVRKL
ncbi:MAG: hypothetical protein LBR72_02640 [Oscillospiraceae bacterium]|jgi:hypothetical protein|nr:hypothetical protein [Oscillospiraceae bacterium]